MKEQTLPKETIAELLHFVADTESFQETFNLLGDSVDPREFKKALHALGTRLGQEARQESGASSITSLKKQPHLSEKTRAVLAGLNAEEEQRLAEGFGFLEE